MEKYVTLAYFKQNGVYSFYGFMDQLKSQIDEKEIPQSF
jgi:hypothetical protein